MATRSSGCGLPAVFSRSGSGGLWSHGMWVPRAVRRRLAACWLTGLASTSACGLMSLVCALGANAAGAGTEAMAATQTQSVHPCRDGQVTLESPAQVEGLLGTTIVSVKIRDTGKAGCTLRGYAQIAVRSPKGARISIKVIHAEFGPKEPRHVSTQTLAPHQSGAVFDLSFIDHPSPEPASDCRRLALVSAKLPGQSGWLRARIAIDTSDCEGKPLVVNLSPIGA